jgi:hypothetical protein
MMDRALAKAQVLVNIHSLKQPAKFTELVSKAAALVLRARVKALVVPVVLAVQVLNMTAAIPA